MLEIKKLLRKRKLWIGFVCTILCAILISFDLKKEADLEYRLLQTEAIQMENNVNELTEYLFLVEDLYSETLNNKSVELKEAVKRKDWKKVNASFTDVHLLHARRIEALYDRRKYDLYYHDYITHEKDLETIWKERNLPDISKQEIADNWAYSFFDEDETSQFPYHQFAARFYHELAQQNIDTLTYSTTDSATLPVQFIRKLFPFLPVILITLLCFDSIHEDKDSGVLKTLLSQPESRIRYLHKKMKGNMTAICIILIIPLLLLSLGFGLFDHFERINAPVLTNVQGLTSIELMENTLTEIEKQNAQTHTLGITEYFGIPYFTSSPNTFFDLIPMWQFTLYTFVLTLLILLFSMLWTMLWNVICKHKMLSLVCSLGIMILGIAVVQPQNTAGWLAWFPFTYFNPVHIVSGFSSYTYLNGIITLSISCIVLYVVTRWLFKRKDIA